MATTAQPPVLPTPEEQPTVSVEVAGQAVGLGRNATYEAIKRGEIPTIRLGRKIRVPTAPLRAMLGLDVGGGHAA